ncbi:MAG: ABC transporter permease [Sulfurospirillum sp.]
MKSLKNHISVILTLFVLLFSVQFSIEMYKVIEEQNQKLIENYSIVVVSQKRLKIENIHDAIKDIDSIFPISTKKIIDKLKNSMTPENLSMLKIALPYFYTLKLNTLPDKNRLEKIKHTLMSVKSISRVEIFTKTYEGIYRILQILQFFTYIFNAIIFFMSILLLFKHIKIWILEHEEKIKIMGYFGASYWIKSAFLYRLVFIDSLVSTMFVGLLFFYFSNSLYIENKLSILNISLPKFSIVYDAGVLFAIALSLSLVIVTIVSRKMSR